MISNEEFAQRALLYGRPASRFRPSAVYDRDGDCIEFLVKPDPFFAERVDERLTVYCSQDTGEVIGSLIKGVRGFCRDLLERAPGFLLIVQDGSVRLEHLFLARLMTSDFAPEELPTLTYRKLIDLAEESEAEVQGDFRELCHA